MKIFLSSLGCARNLIDSEIMLGRLKTAGAAFVDDPTDAEVIIVNTCSFIESAADESIDTIFELAKCKENGNCRRLIVTGCLPERYREDIVRVMPEVDLFLGTGAFDRIVSAVDGCPDTSRCILPDPDLLVPSGAGDPRVQTTAHMAYLKIAEGCSKHCTYCIIPRLRGRQKSRSIADIITEARHLVQNGVKELVLVAQDTTAYGKDRGDSSDLSKLLQSLAEIPPHPEPCAGSGPAAEPFWIRYLYGHPESIDDSVIRTVANYANICSYFDIPIQHAGNTVLKKMGRHYSRDDLHRLIDRIRTTLPGAAIRTTVIVGFPGETDKEFDELIKFIEDVRFNHLGCFVYSDSEDLPSHRLPGHVPQAVAKERYDALMSSQANISLGHNRSFTGKTVRVLVEERSEEGLFSGRTALQAPEVDGMTYIRAKLLQTGCMTDVRITDALEYDLVGEAV